MLLRQQFCDLGQLSSRLKAMLLGSSQQSKKDQALVDMRQIYYQASMLGSILLKSGGCLIFFMKGMLQHTSWQLEDQKALQLSQMVGDVSFERKRYQFSCTTKQNKINKIMLGSLTQMLKRYMHSALKWSPVSFIIYTMQRDQKKGFLAVIFF